MNKDTFQEPVDTQDKDAVMRRRRIEEHQEKLRDEHYNFTGSYGVNQEIKIGLNRV